MAGYSTAAKNAGANSIRALLTSNTGFVSMHTADPGSTGTSEVTGTGYARGSSLFATASGGSCAGAQASVTMPTGASTTVTFWGLWDAVTGGNWVTGGAVTPSETFSTSGGAFQFTPTITATG